MARHWVPPRPMEPSGFPIDDAVFAAAARKRAAKIAPPPPGMKRIVLQAGPEEDRADVSDLLARQPTLKPKRRRVVLKSDPARPPSPRVTHLAEFAGADRVTERKAAAQAAHRELKQAGYRKLAAARKHTPSQKLGRTTAYSGTYDRRETTYRHPDGRSARMIERWGKYGPHRIAVHHEEPPPAAKSLAQKALPKHIAAHEHAQRQAEGGADARLIDRFTETRFARRARLKRKQVDPATQAALRRLWGPRGPVLEARPGGS